MYLNDEQAADVWQAGYEAHHDWLAYPDDTEARDYANTMWLAYTFFTDCYIPKA
jgi:hypothetical protein